MTDLDALIEARYTELLAQDYRDTEGKALSPTALAGLLKGALSYLEFKKGGAAPDGVGAALRSDDE